MPPQTSSNESWTQWRQYVLKELERLSKVVEKNAEVSSDLHTEILECGKQFTKDLLDAKLEIAKELAESNKAILVELAKATETFTTKVHDTETSLIKLSTKTGLVISALGAIGGFIASIAINVFSSHFKDIITIIQNL